MAVDLACVQWRRHGRARRIILRIDARAGMVVVTLPAGADRAAGIALLNLHANWVKAGLAALPDAVSLRPGGSVAIDGVAHGIRHVAAARRGAWLTQGELHVAGDAADLPDRIAGFLRAEACRRLTAQAQSMAAQAGLALRRVSVRDTRTRWGSCSARGALMFCWRLVMAPPFVQHWVVAHEVAHLRHLDHGPEFTALAEALSPHRRDALSWLRREGPGLLRVG